MKKWVLVLLIAFLMVGCGTSESAVQTAIAETEAARPTETYTVIPTDTSTVTPTNTPTITLTPSDTPTETPTLTPSITPSETPTVTPTPLPLEERILGSWTGAYTNKQGDKILGTWSFYEGGVKVTEVTLFGTSYGSKWWVEGNRVYMVSELSPDETTYRDIEFITDDVMIATKEESDIVETWTRKKDE